jgi:hypothetical protein
MRRNFFLAGAKLINLATHCHQKEGKWRIYRLNLSG